MCLRVKGLWSSLGRLECPDNVAVASPRTGYLKRTRKKPCDKYLILLTVYRRTPSYQFTRRRMKAASTP